MTRLITAGLILSILSGVAFCPYPYPDKRKFDAAFNEVCNNESIRNFIKCEVTPSRFRMDSFLWRPLTCCWPAGVLHGDSPNGQPTRSGIIIFGTAEPSPVGPLSDISKLRLIWKLHKTITPYQRVYVKKSPVHGEIKVRLFCLLYYHYYHYRKKNSVLFDPYHYNTHCAKPSIVPINLSTTMPKRLSSPTLSLHVQLHVLTLPVNFVLQVAMKVRFRKVQMATYALFVATVYINVFCFTSSSAYRAP